ncbi:hypothetical protein WG66_001057, partial [Moniliophthora roreri]
HQLAPHFPLLSQLFAGLKSEIWNLPLHFPLCQTFLSKITNCGSPHKSS